MSEIQEHVAHLSQTIGPRPAGTEEEQQAALYISDVFQHEAGLAAEVEDFNCNPNYEMPRAICSGVAVVMALVALFAPIAVIPALIVSLIAVVLFGLETFWQPVVARLLSQGVSQNVVTKYEPAASSATASPRRRKIVLVARYDSGKVRKDLGSAVLATYPYVKWAEFAGLVLIPLLLLLRFVSNAEGGLLIFLNILSVVSMILAALPLVGFLVRRFAPYNEGANCNAAGVSVLAEVATRIGRGRVSEEEIEARMHGEEAAREMGLVPEGAEFEYDDSYGASPIKEPEFAEESPEARLLAAKAAVAALSGKPVSNTINIDISHNLVQVNGSLPIEATEEEKRARREETHAAFAPRAPYGEAAGAGVAASEHGAAADFAAVSGQAADQGTAGVESALGAAGDAAGWGASSAADGAVAAGVAGATAAAGAAAAAANAASAAAETAGGSNVADANPSAAPANAGVPDWFKTAQAKAKKSPAAPASPSQRSRYADALDAAAARGAASISPSAASASVDEPSRATPFAASSEVDQRLQRMRENIVATEMPDVEDVANMVAAEGSQAEPSEFAAAVASGAPGVLAEALPVETSGAEISPDKTHAFEPVAVDADEMRRAAADLRNARVSGAGASGAAATAADSGVAGTISPVSVVPSASPTPASAPASPFEGRSAVGRVNVLDADAIPALDSVNLNLPNVSGETLSAAESAAAQAQPGQPHQPKQRKKRAITLPSFTGSFAPLDTTTQHRQSAPLAQSPAGAAEGEDNAAAQQAARQASLRAALPSLSGILNMKEDAHASEGSSEAEEPAQASAQNVNQAGAFASVGATGAFAPVGDELLDDVSPDDMYVDDADDSAYEEQYTETGAFAGPGYVDMPKSRAGRFFGKFKFGRKKDQQVESSAQEWLDVDENFEARAVGQARGGWESFRQDAGDTQMLDQSQLQGGSYDDYAEDDGYDDYDDYGYDEWEDEQPAAPTPSGSRPWNGGAFSRETLSKLTKRGSKAGRKNRAGKAARADEASAAGDYVDGYDDYENGYDEYNDNDANYGAYDAYDARGGYNTDAAVDQAAGSVSGYAESAADVPATSASATGRVVIDPLADGASYAAEPAEHAAADLDEVHAENVQRIYGFRHPDINTEVWFVALGAELAGNGGMEAFIAEHEADLKGSIIIELDGLGAGDLSLVEREGTFRAVKSSSRMKRYTRKASQTLGMGVSTTSMLWNDGAAVCAARHGYQTMHLAGMEGGKPAFYGEADDIADNVSEEAMLANADFVMEILKNI
ncbi:MAG: hypothetical protein Q4C41_01300 [Eggerthellaceae bacterium]|nr:hypothetical protein [Eggerthellaceae bacterium]